MGEGRGETGKFTAATSCFTAMTTTATITHAIALFTGVTTTTATTANNTAEAQSIIANKSSVYFVIYTSKQQAIHRTPPA